MKRVKNHLLISLFCYISIAFIQWDLFWILKIPNYAMEKRGAMLVCVIMIHFLVELFKPKEANENAN